MGDRKETSRQQPRYGSTRIFIHLSIAHSPTSTQLKKSWWRHRMETFSALLALCAGNSPVTGEFPSQRPVTRSFDILFHLRLNKRLNKQSWGWWFDGVHYDVIVMYSTMRSRYNTTHPPLLNLNRQHTQINPSIRSRLWGAFGEFKSDDYFT